jgi:trans-aconitate methyltransferase
MAEDSGQSVLSSLESHVLPLVPDIRKRLSRGIDVLDLGCGSGRIINRLAQLFPSSRFGGQDLSAEAVSAATRLISHSAAIGTSSRAPARRIGLGRRARPKRG